MSPHRKNAVRFYCWRRLRSYPTLTKAELAEELGLSVTTLYEYGVRTNHQPNNPAGFGPDMLPTDSMMRTGWAFRHHFGLGA